MQQHKYVCLFLCFTIKNIHLFSFFLMSQLTAGTNSRKRVREEGTSPNVINHFSLQPPQPSQIIHLSQLHNHQQQQQQNVSTGLRLSFDDQQQQRLQLQLQLHQHQQQQGCHSSSFSSLLPQGLVSQIKQQHDELDQYLQTQVNNKIFNFRFITNSIERNDFEFLYVMGISGRESTADIGGEKAKTLPGAIKCGGGSGGTPVKRERSGICKSHTQERGVRSAYGPVNHGSPSMAGKSPGPRSRSSFSASPAATDNNVPNR